ncbi:Protein shisa-4 Transmembrane protein 58 Precursor [Larimichthys crocea]|uniref:Protein shisa-5 n=1 Tax=Larimichthys crocea TaxID=215358 RepID=A0A6G0J3V1_LARCR|nr:Protein shisa-4 Transmembrane protein 58 Precursor [Larimichthys crocea]
MVSSVLSSLVCVFCVILLPAVTGDYCNSYWDKQGQYHEDQQCFISSFCCGDCYNKYCCSEKKHRLTEEKQDRCTEGYSSARKKIPMILGSVLGSIVPIIFCVCLIICCVAPCCFCYKKCRKGQRQTVRNGVTVVNAPQQLPSPSGYQPAHPVYQPVPVHPGYGGLPNPTAPPPSYMEATNPAYSPVAFNQGQPMYPMPSQPYAPPNEFVQLPYNPAYGPNP